MTITDVDLTKNSLCFIKHNNAMDVCLQMTYSQKTDKGIKVYGFWWNLGNEKSFNIGEWGEFEIENSDIQNWKFCIKEPTNRHSLSLRENNQWL